MTKTVPFAPSFAALTLQAAARLAALPLLANPTHAAPAPEPIQLRLIAINDFHGNLEEGQLELRWPNPNSGATTPLPSGGAPALAGLVTSLRQGAPHSLVVSSGDLVGATPLISALFRHEPTIAIANQIGVDLAIPGNHEFDAGSTELLRLLKGGCQTKEPATPQPGRSRAGETAAGSAGATPTPPCALGPHQPARFATIAANITTPTGATLFPATAIRNFAGVKVGFIGATTASTPKIVIASGIQGLHFGDESEAINRAADALQRPGVQAIVAVIHEGGETGAAGQRLDWNNPSCPMARGPLFAIARQRAPATDVVFSAHSHQGYNCRINGRPILQATAFGRGVAVVDLALNPRTGDVDRTRTISRNLPVLNGRTNPQLRQTVLAAEPAWWRAVLARATPDPAVAERVARYARAAAPIASRAVGRIGGSFDRGGATDSAAGRLIADAQLAATQSPAAGDAQAALMNPGGIRTNLMCRAAPPCTVTYGDIFAMQPFGNSLVVLTLSGAELKQLLERQQPPGAPRPTFLQPSASLRYSWVVQAPYGERVRQLRLNGQPIQAQQPVRLVVNSFLAQGGDGFEGFRLGRDQRGGPLEVDALAAHLRSNPVPIHQPRIVLIRQTVGYVHLLRPVSTETDAPRMDSHHTFPQGDPDADLLNRATRASQEGNKEGKSLRSRRAGAKGTDKRGQNQRTVQSRCARQDGDRLAVDGTDAEGHGRTDL
ncbi:MAG: bifunctional metallophosphatase/5'-nucleotidase [Cyanobacteriota bacterium]